MSLDERVARLEANVENIQANLVRVENKVDRLDDKIDAIKDSIASAKIWAIWLYVGMGVGLLSAMASGFLVLDKRQDEILEQVQTIAAAVAALQPAAR